MGLTHTPGQRTWDDDKRCAECCTGDRCDDPTHIARSNCPHCMGTGWALWTEAGRADYSNYLQRYCGMNEADASAEIDKLTRSQA